MKRRFETAMAVAFALAAAAIVAGSGVLAVDFVAYHRYPSVTMALPLGVVVGMLGLAVLFFRWVVR